VYSLLLGMSVADISGLAVANLGVDELRHLAPLYHGDTLYGVSEVLSLRPSASRPGQGVLQVRTDGFKQDGVKVCSFRRAVLLPVRPNEAAGVVG
jgi:acyl dehydratase